MQRKRSAGFSLLELMIVIAIIGILAAVAIPQYQRYVARSQLSEVFHLIAPAKISIQELAQEGLLGPSINTPEQIGLSQHEGKYVKDITVNADTAKATLTITFNSHSASELRNKTMTMVITPKAAQSLVCQEGGKQPIEASLFPASCRATN